MAGASAFDIEQEGINPEDSGNSLDRQSSWSPDDPGANDQNMSLALLVPDLTGDGAWDLLQHNLTYSERNLTFITGISVVSGADGAAIWTLELPGAVAYAIPVNDLERRRDK